MARAKKPTGKHPAPEAPAPAATMIADSTLRPPAREAALDPIAPVPAATLIGPHATKPPAKKARPATLPGRTRPLPPARPAVPKPAAKAKHAPADPARLRAALDAVLAAPDDDGPRRAYGALLSAGGDPRGDFITIGLDAKEPDRDERSRALLARNATKWTKPLKAIGKQTRWRWHRGFVHELRVNGYDAGCTPSNVSAVLDAEPVGELAIEGCDPDQLARLLALPGIERVKRLAISGWNASEGGGFVARVLAKATRLTGVVELRAGIKLGDAGLAALGETVALDSVVHLALGAADASTEAFAKLAASPLGQHLETLEWLRQELSDDMAKVVVSMPSLQTFVASTGYVDAFVNVFRPRFRDRFVIENEPGTGYLLDGVRGVSYRSPPKR